MFGLFAKRIKSSPIAGAELSVVSVQAPEPAAARPWGAPESMRSPVGLVSTSDRGWRSLAVRMRVWTVAVVLVSTVWHLGALWGASLRAVNADFSSDHRDAIPSPSVRGILSWF